jgi:hypothetical protein
MTDWTAHEHMALTAFLTSPGPLRAALAKFIEGRARDHKAMCAAAMATVPRDPERASDYAARAAELSEFWEALGDELANSEVPSQEPTP